MTASIQTARRPFLAVLIPFLMLFYAEFWALVPANIATGLVYFSVSVVTLLWIGTGLTLNSHPVLRLAWLAFAVWALASHLIKADYVRLSVIVFVLFVVVMFAAPQWRQWTGPAIALLIAFGSVHAVATISFAILPDLYSNVVKPTFFATDRLAIGFESGLTTHYSFNATYIALAVVALASYLLFERSTNGRRFLVLVLMADVIALLMTSKRAQLLVALLAIVFVYALSASRFKLFRVVSVLAILGFLVNLSSLFVPAIAHSIERLMETAESTDLNEATTGRVFLWEAAIDGGTRAPLTGQGWGDFYYSWGGTAGAAAYVAHNELLNVFYALGFPGLIVVTVLFVVTLVKSARIVQSLVRRPEEKGRARGIAAAAYAVQVFLLFYGVTTGSLLSDVYTFGPYTLSIAVLLAIAEPRNGRVKTYGLHDMRLSRDKVGEAR